jgi:alkanesulfonate monooxygenase SsuD/methylene tetrahydromethanopterin reductase-like flavin-dependent oxidoreductase (luciferase family)
MARMLKLGEKGCAHPALWPDMELASVSPDADAWYDPFPCIGAIGQESDLPMGACVTDAIRRRAPDVARTALTLHQLCRGGFHLGVGAEEAENLVPFGYDFSTPLRSWRISDRAAIAPRSRRHAVRILRANRSAAAA